MCLIRCALGASLLLPGAVLPVAATAADGPARPSALAAAMSSPNVGHIDAAARQRLVGKHLMTLQWIDWGDLSSAGSVTIQSDGTALAITGEERGRGQSDGDYLQIKGRIVSADENSFAFEGDIVTRIAANGDGSQCRRSGTMRLLTTG